MIDSVQLINLVTGQSQVLDQDQSEFVLTELDLGQVTAEHITSSYYDQIGATIDSSVIQPRMVSVTGWIIGDTREQIKINKKALNRLINPLQELQLVVYDKYSLVCKPDYSVNYGKTIQENNDFMCKFLIQGTCGNPLFTTISKEEAVLSAIEGQPLFPLTIPQGTGMIFGKRTPQQIAALNNEGDSPVGLTIVLNAIDTVVNPVITLIETQESISLNKTLAQGEQVVISTGRGSKRITGSLNGVEQNYIQYLRYPSTWLQLAPGENSIQYSADSGVSNLQVTISFAPGYMEVEE